MYGRYMFSYKKNFANVYKLFKEGWNSIQDENKLGRPKMPNTLEMTNSVNALILADRRIKIEDISEKLGISVGIVHKNVRDDLASS